MRHKLSKAQTGARRLEEHALWRDAERYLAERFQLAAPGGFMLLMGMLSVPLGMLLSRSLLGGLILPAVLGASAAGLALRYRRERRDATEQEIPEVFRTLALGLEAGQTLRQAMEYVGVTHAGAGSAEALPRRRSRCRQAHRLQRRSDLSSVRSKDRAWRSW
jgi:Flp pilus assembly protein TadB